MQDTVVAVTTTSQLVLARAVKRDIVILVNDSDTDIYVRFDTAAEVNKGIRLNADGGNIVITGGVPPEAIYAIHGGSGSKNLLINYVQI